MVDLNDEDAVHRQAMHFYRESLAREASVRRSRYGTLTYREDGEHSFWLDGARSALYGPADKERQARLRDHANQMRNHPEYRAINTTVGTGGAATMPVWDESHFVIGAHALAPIAALATNLPLSPDANAMILPRIATGVTAAAQSAQNVGVTDGSTTYVDATTTCDVITALGQITLSRQLIDQGVPHGYDQVIARELGAAIGATKESQIVSGAGNGSNQLLGLVNQSGVQTISATGSVAGIYNAVSAAVALISTTRFRLPDFVAGSPELYAYLAGSIDTTGRPLMPPRPSDTFSGVAPESVPAELLGMKYIADPQVAASLGSQYLIVGVSSDLVLWSGPIEVTFSPETYTSNMSVLVSAHQYLAFGLMYPSSAVLVGPFSVPGLPGS
jgi:HK97 family phage major capsid protein